MLSQCTKQAMLESFRIELKDCSLLSFVQDALSDAEKAAAKKLSENEERLVELTDKWKDRWKETQKIMQVMSLSHYSV